MTIRLAFLMRVAAVFAAAGAGVLPPASPLSAQMLKGHDSNAPVDFAADRIEVQDRADRAILSGNVRVAQAGLTLAADRLTIAYIGRLTQGNPQVNRLDAAGGVQVHSGDDSARGDLAVYDFEKRLITMVGNVTLNQGTNVVRGHRLIIDLASGRSVIDGAASEGGAGSARAPDARVTGRLTVTRQAHPAGEGPAR